MADFINATIEQHEFDKVIVFPLLIKSPYKTEQCYWKNKQYIACKNWDENGILKMEFDFPKTMKTYWDNGKLENEATGILYKGEQDVILLDSGLHVSYSESGKKITQTHWKNKKEIASKKWNEIGILTLDFSFPKYLKSYCFPSAHKEPL